MLFIMLTKRDLKVIDFEQVKSSSKLCQSAISSFLFYLGYAEKHKARLANDAFSEYWNSYNTKEYLECMARAEFELEQAILWAKSAREWKAFLNE